jgi:hypothetical protein
MGAYSGGLSSPQVRSTGARHPAFFPAMSALLIVIVFLGFAPTYYLRPSDAPSLPVYLHLHGAALTLWFALLLIQTGLIASRRRALHRQMGVGGVALAAAMVCLTPLVVVWAVPRFLTSGLPLNTVTLIVIGDLVAVVVFALLVIFAVRMRRVPETHSRLMLLASIPIVAPALGRMSITMTGAPIAGLVIQMALPLLLVAHDVVMMGRVHRATAWGMAAVVGSMLLSIGVANTEAGRAFVRLLQ